MTKNGKNKDNIRREIRQRQKFSMAGAIGRLAGGAMKGASPVPKLNQVKSEIIQFVDSNISDPSGALKSTLRRRIKASTVIVDRNLDEPMPALREIIQPILEKEAVLYEFVRQVDMRWGEMASERPHFQQPGQAPHPDDDYSHASVKKSLMDLMVVVLAEIGLGSE